jgi:uncharacterized protein YqgV (UPF0045/DUF77 family)
MIFNMPLDPKEFEKVFADHFESISPEEFLDNLKESSPYLFDEGLTVSTNTIKIAEDRDRHVKITDDKVQHS